MPRASTWTYRAAKQLYDHRWMALVGAVVCTALAVVPALQVRVDTSVQKWFTEGDPALEAYRDFQETYGNDEVVLIGLHRSDGVLTVKGIPLIKSATDRVRSVKGVANVTSLATQTHTQPTLTGPQFVPLLPGGSPASTDAQVLRSRILADSTYDRLVSDDGTMAALYARMERNSVIDGKRGAILDSIRQTLAPLDASVHVAGTGVILNALNEATTEDSFVFILASSLLLFLLLWAFFRRLTPVFVTVGVVAVATIWLMGAYGLAGKHINMVTVVMPTLVLVVCVADCVHLLVYAAELPASLSARERAVHTLSDLAVPCAITTLTTAAGFASLGTSSMAIVRDLGLFSAVGVVAGLVAAFIGCAVGLSFAATLPNRPSNSWLQKIVDTTVELGIRRWRPVLVGTGLVVIVASVGLGCLQADTHPIGYLFPDHPVRQDSDRIERTLGAYAPLEFVVRSDSSVLEAKLLRAVSTWQTRAVETGTVKWHQSPVDDLRRLHAALPDGTPTVPANPRRLRGLVQLGDGELPYVTDLNAHPNRLRVTFGTPIRSAAGIQQAIDSVRAAAHLPSDASIQATGYLPLYVRMVTLLTESMARSFGLALLVILGGIGVLFRSVQVALLSLLPNGLPIVLVLGLMGWGSIPLDMATMTIAAVVFGLVVDDTIHLLYRYTTALESSSAVSAMRTSARETGRRMAITTTVLAGGFLVLCFAQIKSIVWLGLLSAIAIVVALATDVLVLPAVLTGVHNGDDN